MRQSLIICSRNRASQLRRALAALNLEAMRRLEVELLLVDSASDDDTAAVMTDFAAGCGLAARVFRADRPGASRARNIAARAACGEVLIFTDDDCYLDAGYFDAVARDFDPRRFQYGGGDTRLFDPADHRSGVTELNGLAGVEALAPRTLLTPGLLQTANMVFLRSAFEALGGFDERLGAGTPFPCEDIELCVRASLRGYTGALLARAKVLHHHGRRAGTEALRQAHEGYDRGRGAYFAGLLAAGQRRAFSLWAQGGHLSDGEPMSREGLATLRDELRGAADYLQMLLGEEPPPT